MMAQPREPLSNDDIDILMDSLTHWASRSDMRVNALSTIFDALQEIDDVPPDLKAKLERDVGEMKIDEFEFKRKKHDKSVEIKAKLIGYRPVDGKAKANPPTPSLTEATVSPLVNYSEMVKDIEKVMILLDEGKVVEARMALGSLRDKVKGKVGAK